MYKLLPSILLVLIFSSYCKAQSSDSWKVDRTPLSAFIENKGQFVPRNTLMTDEKVHYGFDGRHEDFYFTSDGVIIELTHQEKRKKSDEEKAARAEKKKVGFKDAAEFRAFEEVGHSMKITKDEVVVKWLGANKNVQIVAEDINNYAHSYNFYETGKLVNKHGLKSWKKLTYKNLYDNIDVVYEIHPVSGYKYTLVLHPGADLSKVRLKYSKDILKNFDGSISISSVFGNLTDHAPLTFYQNNHNSIVKSDFIIENGEVRFYVDNYDKAKTLTEF